MKINSKGITLIALVVTVIVLIILAGVSISLVLGDNGIISKAKLGKENTQIAANEEQEGLANLEVAIQEGINGENSGTNSLPSAAGTTPYFPSSDFSKVSGTSLVNGLVIQDKVGNEYVWIEVPNYYDEAADKWTGPNYSAVDSSVDYDNIEIALQNYAEKYRISTYVDEWYDGEGKTATEISSGSGSSSASGSGSQISENLEDTSGCGLTYAQYTTLKHKMLTSIYENGGFWIGRYEAGISAPRTEHSDVTTSTTIKVLSQQNQYPLSCVYCREAQLLALKVATDAELENYTTSLMFGIQWDLVLTYLEKKGTSYADLATDSTSWGNYKNNLWTISNTNAKYYTNSTTGWVSGAYGEKTSDMGVLLSTGADASFSKMNIYDLAGNVTELTLEYIQFPEAPICDRGGSEDSYRQLHSSWLSPRRSNRLVQRWHRLSRLTLLVALNPDSDKL